MKTVRLLLASALLAVTAFAQSGVSDLVVARTVKLQGFATPATLSADANDYAPAGFANATTIKLSSSAAVNISGLAGGAAGRIVWLVNVGTFPISLLNESTLSIAANRFTIGSTTVVGPQTAVSFIYDGTASRWVGLVQGKASVVWGGIAGTLSDQTDLNNLTARIASAALTSGVVAESDTVLFSAPNATTLRIAALQGGVFAPLLAPGQPTTAAFKSFAQQDYPLASLGLAIDGTFARWIGYNSSGTVVASAQSFVNDATVIGLGAIVVKRVGGVTSFIDDGGPRSFATLPQMAGFSELERTYLGYRSTVTVTPNGANMNLNRSAGTILGISVNWTGSGNKNSLDQAAATTAGFIQVNPSIASATSLPAPVTVLTATNYWNGAASVPLAANNNASVKRFLLGIKGGLFVQEGEAQYTNLDLAVAAYATAPFTTLLAQDLFIEIGRLAVVKNATDLSNPGQARFFVTGVGAAGGSTGGSPSAVTSVNGTVGEINANSPVGAVTLSLPNALVFTGKTVADGTFNAPTLVNAALGTPASGNAQNLTGTAAGLTAGNVTTNANLTGDVTSVGNATTLATVTAATGSFGSSSLIPVITVNAKGLVTNVTTSAVAAAAAGTLTGATLAANVVNASLNSITPTGGTLTVSGAIAATDLQARGGSLLKLYDSANADYAYMANTGGSSATQSILYYSAGQGAAAHTMRTFNGSSTVDALKIAPSGAVTLANKLTLPTVGAGTVAIGSGTARLDLGYSSTLGGNYLESINPSGGAQDMIYYMGGANAHRFYVSGAEVGRFHGSGFDVTGNLGATGQLFSSFAGSEVFRSGSTGYTNAIRGLAINNSAGSDTGGFFQAGSTYTNFGLTANDTFAYAPQAFGVVTAGVLRARYSSSGLVVAGGLSTTASIVSIGTTATGGAAFRSGFSGSAMAGIDLADTTDFSNVAFVVFRNSAAAAIGSINRVGTTNAVAFNTTSDSRLKKNVRDFTAKDSGPIIDGLRPRWFDWASGKDNDAKNIIGFIAQEEATVDSALLRIGAVTRGDDKPKLEKDGRQWQRSDAALVPIMVAELKALRARVATLEGQKTAANTTAFTLAAGFIATLIIARRFVL